MERKRGRPLPYRSNDWVSDAFRSNMERGNAMFGSKGENGSERRNYLSRMKAKLDDWDAEVNELELNSQRLKSSVIDDHQKLINELERQMTKGREKMKEIIGSTDDSWHTIKESADSLMADIRINLDNARKTYHDELEDD
jgi:predicted  nucleic acid-binding Zn-ribbon protein